ncbi:hemophore-related protein [Mycolicibacterium sp.]|uniref:hemophore-related protein n=1 Tax=Mycolicibacterium sp. TaxID=2320850 RepID=UPI003D0EBD70
MNASATTVRRGLFGMFAGGLLAFGTAAILTPMANAQPAPGPDCSASSVAGTVSAATASEGAYLLANPQTNEALSSIAAQPAPAAQTAYQAFFAQNPQVAEQLENIHQPVSALQQQCGIQLSPTPVAQAVWSSTNVGAEVPQVVEPSVLPQAPEAADVTEEPPVPGT